MKLIDRSKRLKANTVISAGLGYTIGNVLIKGINFLALPFFSRIMTTEEIGIYSIFVAYEAILFVIIGMALHSCIRSASYEFENEIDKFISSISLIYLLNTIIFLFIAVVFGDSISSLLGLNKKSIILLVLYSLGTAIITLYNYRLSINYSYKKYLVISFTNSVCNIVISLVLILTIYRTQKNMGRIWGTTIAVIGISIFIFIEIYRKSKPCFNKKYWTFAIKYSLPIIPHGVSQVVLSQCDRIMINKLVSASAAGIYSLVANIKIILTVISDSISNAWSTWFFEKIIEGKDEIIQKRAKQVGLLFAIFTLGLMALSPELVFILGGNQYEIGKFVAIPMLMDAFILFIYDIIVPAEYYKKKTTYIMVGTIGISVLNIILNYIFITKYGFIASAYTTLFSYVCYLTIHIILTRKLIGFYILPLNTLFLYIGVVTISGFFDIIYIESIAIRYLFCSILVSTMSCKLLSDLKK